jgi:ATP-dependent Clp protease ATP-binding subunit ClpA
MFERYSESARRALFFARHGVAQFGGTSIEPEHLLLGLLHESVIWKRLAASEAFSPDDLRRDVQARCAAGDKVSTSVEIPFTPPTQRALRYAAEEADRLKHHSIEPEHLLLGLLREEGSPAASLLAARGFTLAGLRKSVEVLLANASPPPASPAGIAVSEQIEQIKAAVTQLAGINADAPEARILARRIGEQLDLVKRYFG